MLHRQCNTAHHEHVCAEFAVDSSWRVVGVCTGRHDIVQGTGLEEESTSGITAAALRRVMDVKRGWVNDIALNRGAVLLQVMTAFSVVLLGSVAIQPA